jgi:hypothetical protein
MKIAVVLLVSSICLTSNAQEPPSQAPLSQKEILKHAPEYSKWVITYEYLPEESGKASKRSTQTPQENDNRIAKVVITKTKDIVSQMTFTNSGQRSESWLIANMQFNQNQESVGFFETSLEREALDYLPIETGDFSDFSWVGPSTYIGKEQWQGRSALVFHQKKAPEAIDEAISSSSNNSIKKIALIDEISRLPVMLQTQGERRLYKFTELPPETQTLPPQVVSMIQDKEKRRRIMSAPIPRPF